jgi:hypothetical protein
MGFDEDTAGRYAVSIGCCPCFDEAGKLVIFDEGHKAIIDRIDPPPMFASLAKPSRPHKPETRRVEQPWSPEKPPVPIARINRGKSRRARPFPPSESNA